MRVCVISPGVAHAVPRTVAIADQFDEIHFIDMAGNADSRKLVSLGVVYHSAREEGKAIKNGRDLQRLLRNISPDVIVCHYASGDHFFNAITYGRCPVAVIAMGSDIFYERGDTHVPQLQRLLIRMGLKCVDYVSAKSVHLSDQIKAFGVACEVDVNYWGADMRHFKPNNKVAARKKLGINECSGSVILSPRAISPLYNIHLIVEAFRMVSTVRPDALLIILGRSSDAYKQRIEELVEKCNLTDKVQFVGEVDQETLLDYYNASDVVVSMARSEGFPNTLFEVMGCEVPVVVGDISQIGELLANGKNARICEISCNGISRELLGSLENLAESERLVANGRNTIKEFADIFENGKKFSDRLKQICIKHNRKKIFKRMVFSQLYNLNKFLRRLAI